MYRKRALVVGATGIVGLNVAEHLKEKGGWEIHGLSRRPPSGCSWMKSHAVDLLDREAALLTLSRLSPTHIHYCTWTLGRTEDENIRLNGGMLRTVLDAFAGKGCVEHVAVVTGTKHYLGPFEDYGKVTPVTPFVETAPRLEKKNFYYELEDIVMERAQREGFGWSVHRSHTIIGYAVGNLMNIGATLAAYASICKEERLLFIFPGSPTAWTGLNDITDARLLAKQIVWASTEPNARNEAFNAVNGDVFRWTRLWQVIADYFGITAGAYPGAYDSLDARMKDMGPAWIALLQSMACSLNRCPGSLPPGTPTSISAGQWNACTPCRRAGPWLCGLPGYRTILHRRFRPAARGADHSMRKPGSRMLDDLKGKVAIVTGASSGIGLETAKHFLAAGAKVVGAANVMGPFPGLGGPSKICAVEVDLTLSGSAEIVVESALKVFGRIDILFNNAGAAPARKDFLSVTDEDWRSTFELNLMGYVRMARAVIPVMLEQGRGVLVHCGSETGIKPHPLLPDYSVSKSAINLLSKILARDYTGRGIGPTWWRPPIYERSCGMRRAASSTRSPTIMACRAPTVRARLPPS